MFALHFLFGRFKVFLKGPVEIFEGGNIVKLSFGHKVEILFHLGGEFGINNVLEKLLHKAGGDLSQRGRL